MWTFFKDMPPSLLWRYMPQHIMLNLASLVFYPFRGQGRVVLKAKLDALRGLPETLRQRRSIQREHCVDAAAISSALQHGVLSPYIRRYTDLPRTQRIRKSPA